MRGTKNLRPGFCVVFTREFRQFQKRPPLLALTVAVPLVMMAILSLVFIQGAATRLPIAVLDLDGSDLSRTIVRTLDATPDTAVATRVSDLSEGKRLILSGKVFGVLMIPVELERDVFAGRRPEVVFFYNTQTMTGGNLSLRGVNAAMAGVEGGIRLSLRTSHGEPVDIAQPSLSPIPVQVNPLFNPTMNYGHFLLAALLPAVLQIVVVTATAYAVGRDVETAHRLRVLGRLGDGLWPAMFGKLLPYTLVFLFVLGVSDLVLFLWFKMPLRGDRSLLLLSGFLFVLANQLLGAAIAVLVRPMSTAIGIGSLIAAPAFGFMGISFPRIGMNAFAYGWGELLPGTWYLAARIDQTLRGAPLELSTQPLVHLLASVIVLALVTAFGLRRIRGRIERERRLINAEAVA